MTTSDAPALAGIHHLKVPVTDLARSPAWYRGRLGYTVGLEFAEEGQLMGYALAHPNSALRLALRLDPGRARAAVGFDDFCLGGPGKPELDDHVRRLTAQGEACAGVHWASIGWILPALHDPDGPEIRFCTIEQNAGPGPQLAAA